jgi:hypothetical protein
MSTEKFLIVFSLIRDTVGELSRTCCQLVQGGIITELILDKPAHVPLETTQTEFANSIIPVPSVMQAK